MMNVFLHESGQVESGPFGTSEVVKAVQLDSKNETRSAANNISVNVSKDLVAAAGFNVETPIISAIIGNITHTLPTKRNEPIDAVRCNICDCDITSNLILAFHVNGAKHKKKVKALHLIEQLKKEKGVHVELSNHPNAFRCEICSLTVNSPQQLEFHLSGAKHKKKAGQANLNDLDLKTIPDTSESNGPPSPKRKRKEEPKTCGTCSIILNSQTQYDQHLNSKKHRFKVSLMKTTKRSFSSSERGKTSFNFKNSHRGVQGLEFNFCKPFSSCNFNRNECSNKFPSF